MQKKELTGIRKQMVKVCKTGSLCNLEFPHMLPQTANGLELLEMNTFFK